MAYYQRVEGRGRYQRSSWRGLVISILAKSILRLIHFLIVYLPLVLLTWPLSFLLTKLIGLTPIAQLAVELCASYLVFALIYFAKGMIIGLKESKKNWFVVWIFTVLSTCAVQSFLSHQYITSYLGTSGAATLTGWAGAALVGLLMYNYYKFLTNVSPKIVYWSYSLGYRAANFHKTPSMFPQKSQSVFHNSPL
jgi:hypothetical protein